MFESNYNYVPNPYPPAPGPSPQPGQGWIPPHPGPGPVPPVPPFPPGPPVPPGPGPVTPIYVDNTLSIPGAAADAYVTGKLLASKIDLSALEGNIKLIDGKLELDGFNEAAPGTAPVKSNDGKLEWIDIATQEDVEALQNQITEINSSIREINSDIQQLFATNSEQNEKISDLQRLVENNNQRVDEIDAELESLTQTVDNILETKLDKEVFQAFLTTYSEKIESIEHRLDLLEAGLEELQNCCEEVHQTLQQVLGGPENYEQPIYQTLADFETHLQAIQRNFDGGDIDEEVHGEMVEIPNLTGMKYANAELMLGQLGLFTQFSNGDESIPEGMSKDSLVYDYEPQDEAKIGSVVNLEVNWVEEVNG